MPAIAGIHSRLYLAKPRGQTTFCSHEHRLLLSSTKSLLPMSLTPSVMEWKLSGMFWIYFFSCWFERCRWWTDLYGIDLPNVSLIPRAKFTRSKDYHEYHIDITAFTGENRKCIVENLHLDATSEHEWLDSIQSSVTVSSQFSMRSWRTVRFPATVETKIKFEIYGHRLLGPRKHVATAEKTIQDILDARDGDGGEQVNSNESKPIL